MAMAIREMIRLALLAIPLAYAQDKCVSMVSLLQTKMSRIRTPNSSDGFDPDQLSIMIPESRALDTLPLVALHTHHHFPELRIQVVYGSSNKDFVHEQPTLKELRSNGTLVLTEMPSAFFKQSMTVDAYSLMLELPDFWELLLTPKVLLVQTDAWICNGARDRLPQFLGYEYVGAPWGHIVPNCTKNSGNGGFSLRDKQAMLDITKAHPPNGLPEDVYFCSYLNQTAASVNESRVFSVEERLSPEETAPLEPSVGVHALDRHWAPWDSADAFEALCPGVIQMLTWRDSIDDSPGWTNSEAVVQDWRVNTKPRLILLADSPAPEAEARPDVVHLPSLAEHLTR